MFPFACPSRRFLRHYQRFFIGERYLFTRLDCLECRHESSSTDNCRYRTSTSWAVEMFVALTSPPNTSPCDFAEQLTQARHILLILDGDTSGRKFFNLRYKQL